MERETKLLTDMLSNLQELDIALGNQDKINEPHVARQLEKLTVYLEKMANLKSEMDSSLSRELPSSLFAALDKKDQTSLDAFEKEMMKAAVERGDIIRQRAKQRQEIEEKIKTEMLHNREL